MIYRKRKTRTSEPRKNLIRYKDKLKLMGKRLQIAKKRRLGDTDAASPLNRFHQEGTNRAGSAGITTLQKASQGIQTTLLRDPPQGVWERRMNGQRRDLISKRSSEGLSI